MEVTVEQTIYSVEVGLSGAVASVDELDISVNQSPASVEVELTQFSVEVDMAGAQGQKGDDGDDGADGVSVVSAAFVGDDMVFTMSDATTVTIVGAKPLLKGDTGDTGATGETGATGAPGEDGADGIYAVSVAFVGDDMVFTMSDASTISIVGAKTALKGDKGDTGDTGATGETGATGPAGADGSDGNTVLGGAADPTTEGVDGDWYLNTTSYDIFRKISGTWALQINIKGDKGDTGDTGATGETGATGPAGVDGEDGKTWYSGTGDPTTEGVDGDFYLNRSTWHVWEKVSGTWTDRGTIKGADGEGAGDVVGPSSATDGHIVLFDGATGKLVKSAGVAPYSHPATHSADILTDGSTNKAYTATEKTKLSGIEAGADVTDAGNVGTSIHGASAKTTMVDADKLAIIDTEASNVLKTLSWSYVKSILKTYFDGLYQAVGSYLTDIVGDTSPQLGGNLDVNGKTITSASNGDVVVNPDGTGKLDVQKKALFQKQVYHGSEVDNSTTTIDLTTGNRQKKTMGGNITLSITVPSGPASGTIRLIGHSSSTYTVAWPSSSPKCTWLTTAITSITNGKTAVIVWYYDGANLWLSCPGLVTTP